MSKQLLTEFFELCPDGRCLDRLSEAQKREVIQEGAVYLVGRIQTADKKNGNGRVYPMKVLKKEMENYKKIVADGRATGELDHPDDSVINLKNVSHMITDCWWEGKDVMGKIKVLETPAGKTLRALVEGGCQVGISSRGLGTVDENNGAARVNDDFQLICFDMVSEPSTTGAFMMKENKEPNMWTKADRINRLLNDIVKD